MYRLLEKNKVLFVYIPLAVYWILIFILTTIPQGAFNELFKFSDKIKHFIAYTILTVLLSLSLHFQRKISRLSIKYMFYTSIIVLLYATADELHQLFIPGRSAELLDWLADFFGLLLGLFITKKIIIKDNDAIKVNKFGNPVL